MKKTTSFHLEQDIIDEIEAYKEKYDLSSRNVALERMLLERRNFISFQAALNQQAILIQAGLNNENKSNNDIENKSSNKKIKIEDKFSKSIEKGYSDMQD